MGVLTPRKKPGVMRTRMMDANELVVVRYVVSRMTACYCVNGRPKLAKNMNQVMGDIFGVSKFTQRLERGCRDERVMVELMTELKLEKIWALCRSNEHYKMLATLVAIDAHIVSLQKKQKKMRDESSMAPSMQKYKKVEKELKKLLKVYKNCIRTFREVLDIRLTKNRSGKYGGLLDFAKSWQDRYEYDFYGGDFGFGDSIFDGIDESMEAFVREHNGGKAPKGGSGAFGLSDRFFGGMDMEDEDGFDLRHMSDEDDDLPSHGGGSSLDDISVDEVVSRLADEFQRRGLVGAAPVGAAPIYAAAPPPPAPRSAPRNDVDMRLQTLENNMTQMATGMTQVTEALMRLEDRLSGGRVEDDDETEEFETDMVVPRGPSMVQRPVSQDGDDGIPMSDILDNPGDEGGDSAQ